MTALAGAGLFADGASLLERAIGYTLSTVQTLSADELTLPTPCPAWDLCALLQHTNDSLSVLHQCVTNGSVDAGPVDPDPAPQDLGAVLRDRAGLLLTALCARSDRNQVVTVLDRSLAADISMGAGAIEIAAHGWDIAQARGQRSQIPPLLATELLDVSYLVITDATRHPMFARPVAVVPTASPSDRLVAFLGRTPS
ncbi:TIGR03086 family metal-binding protein [Catellatospora tritici]|uniref:TIGR03086 family metal-binding protein n=1 Tax=Catellatospora tritici TaxID=2851566 RepID=UPI001C2D1974|nr:TIGR03086 family metal-binding protein [Catellatospora tritici]MBV1849377.1 TIGR03086 family protein [Catellatospora tritici]